MPIFGPAKDKILLIVLFLPRIDPTFVQRFPQAMKITANGGVTMQFDFLISGLLGIGIDHARTLIQDSAQGIGIGNLEFDPKTKQSNRKEVRSAAEAAGTVARNMSRQFDHGKPLGQVKFYVVARKDLDVYVVIVGNLSQPPAGAAIFGDLENPPDPPAGMGTYAIVVKGH